MGIKIRLEKIEETDKDGNVVKDDVGRPRYSRYDSRVLAELTGLISNEIVTPDKFLTSLTMSDKVQEAFKKELPEIELTMEEGNLLKEVINILATKEVAPQGGEKRKYCIFPPFFIRTLGHVLEQLK